MLAQNLKFLLTDARADVERDHRGFGKGLASTVQATKNGLDLQGKVVEKAGTKQAQRQIAINVGVTLLAVGVTAGVAASHGAALPALIALGAGTFLAKKGAVAGLTEAFNQKRTRDWLNRWDTVDHKTRGARSRALTDDATYSIRKLVVRYRKAIAEHAALQEVIRAIEQGQLDWRKPAAMGEFATRWYRFNWEMHKLRNLLLPSMDAMLFMLNHYITVSDRWNTFYANFTRSVRDWLADPNNHTDCAGDHLCYGPAQPQRSKVGLGGDPLFPADRAPGEMSYKKRFEALRDALAQCDLDIEQTIKRGVYQPLEQTAKKIANQAKRHRGVTHPRTPEKITEEARKLLDVAFAQAQQKKQEAPVLGMLRSWNEKSTRGEKFGAVAQMGIGLAFAGASPEVSALLSTSLTDVASHGVHAFGTTLFQMDEGEVINQLLKGPKMLTRELLNTAADKVPKKLEEIDENKFDYKTGKLTDEQWNKLAATFEEYFRKIGDHGTKGNDILKGLQGLENKTHGSCAGVYATTKRIMAFAHHMDKMAHNCCKVLAFQQHMIDECIRLSYLEKGYAKYLVEQLCWAIALAPAPPSGTATTARGAVK
jgi:hypothetical protein